MPNDDLPPMQFSFAATEAGDQAVLEFRVQMRFAIQHLYAAARFSRRVAEVERQYDGQPFGPWHNEVLQFSFACTFTAVAALEAYANELFEDRASMFPNVRSDQLHQQWEDCQSIIEKFQLALSLRHKPGLPTGKSPCQDIKTLIDLRNALTHFKPEWPEEGKKHLKLSEKLQDKFKPSRCFPREPVFPQAWATHACTKWAVEHSVEFLREFEALADRPARWDWSDPDLQA